MVLHLSAQGCFEFGVDEAQVYQEIRYLHLGSSFWSNEKELNKIWKRAFPPRKEKSASLGNTEMEVDIQICRCLVGQKILN